LIKMEVLMDSY